LALLELRRDEVARARALAQAIATGPEELRPRARFIEAAALLVEKKPEAVRALLDASRAELMASKKPSDMMLLSVLGAADPEKFAAIAAVVRERMALAQRKELAAQLPALAR